MSSPHVAANPKVGGIPEAIAQCLARYASVLPTRALCAAVCDGSIPLSTIFRARRVRVRSQLPAHG